MVSIDRDFKRKYPALLNYIRIMKRTNPFHLEHVNCIGDKLVFVLLNKKTLNISISELPVNAVDDFNSLKNNFEISSYVKIFNLFKNYNFVMIYLNELKKYFSDVPEVFVQYLGIKIETENDVVLNKIYKIIFGEKIDEIERQKID